jgi:ABC-2 type transport system permease protein
MRRNYKNKNFKLQKQQRNSQKRTLAKRELRTLFSIPVYLLNVITGPILSIICSVVLAVMVSKTGGDTAVKQILMAIAPAILLFMHMLVPSTASSISLEGKNYWIIKSSPIKESHYLACKLGTNFLVNTIPAAISCIILSIFVAPSFKFVLTLFVFAVGGSILSGNLGLLFNLKFPKLNWENEAQIVKYGLPLILTMIITFVLVGVSVATSVLPKTAYAVELAMLIESLFIVVSSVITFYFVMKKGPEMLKKV